MRKKTLFYIILLVIGILVCFYVKRKKEGSNTYPFLDWPGRVLILPGQNN